MGSAPGADFFAQKLLIDLLENKPNGLQRIKVYHKGAQAEKLADQRLETVGGFMSHDKDAAMTQNSDFDSSKKLYGEKFNPDKISNTQKNLQRRSIGAKKI